MKTRLLIIVLALVAVIATGCKKATYLRADKASIALSRSGGSVTVTLSSDVDGFSVESAPEWVDAQITDSTLVVSAGENDANSMRSSAITVKAGGLLLEIPIKQVFEATHLSVPSETVVFPKEGGEKTVDVDCDGDVEIRSVPDGVTASYESGVLTIVAKKNDKGAIKGNIQLSAGKLTAEVPVKVEGNICTRCGGSGKITCSTCHGDGFYWTQYYSESCIWGCERCGGDGYGGPRGFCQYGTGKITCPQCHGSGH